jgi:hypothetical protein
MTVNTCLTLLAVKGLSIRPKVKRRRSASAVCQCFAIQNGAK